MKIRVNRWLNSVGAIGAGTIVVGFCLILLWHDPLVFWNDDYELSILPVFADVARSWSEGHWPLLSPYSWVCSNLGGEFQYGTFSVFVNAAVILIWKFPLAFPQQAAALSITHLFVLAAGAFLLVRDRRFPVPLSIFVALVAALNGWIICWGASDWFGALGAFAWFPWAWWGLERALDRQRNRWRFLWPAPFVYLVVTGGFPYTVLMLALLIAWLSTRLLIQSRSILAIMPMLFGAALGFGLSAPAWLAIFDYVRGSARQMQPSSAHWQWIVPPTALPGLVLPSWTVKWANFFTRLMPHPATELACGFVPPAALIAGLIGRGRVLVRQIGWELSLLLLVLLFSILPSAGVFRWSFRWLPFFYLILALCAAEALRAFYGGKKTPTAEDAELVVSPEKLPATSAFSAMKNPGFVGLTAVAFASGAMLILRTSGEYAFPLTWILLAIATIWAFAEFASRNEALRLWMPACVTFAALLATYLCLPLNCGVPKYNLSQELTKPAPLDPQRLYLSIYPPAENAYRIETKPAPVGQTVRPGSTSMWAALRFVNGYSPILAAGVAREFKFAIHGEIDPDIGRYLLEQQGGADGELAKLGVDGITIAQEVDGDPRPASEWELAVQTEEGRVFHRIGAPFAPVRSITAIDSRPNEQFASATISRISDSRNFVALDVDAPGGSRSALLTFSRPYFRGYEAKLGNQELAVTSYRGLFPMVEVPAGSHGRLSLIYRPWWLVLGGGLSILCAMFFLTASFVASRHRR